MSLVLPKETINAPLSKKVITRYNKLIKTVQQFPHENYSKKLLKGIGGSVSIADLMSYEIGLGTLLLSWYDAGLKGKMPEMPPDGFSTWDYEGLAKHFYATYHYHGREKQFQRFEIVVKKIIGMIEHEHQTGNLDKIGVWQWCTTESGQQWPLRKWVQIYLASLLSLRIKLVDALHS